MRNGGIMKNIISLAIVSCNLLTAAQMELIDLKKLITSIILDIRYATENNFVGKPVYQSAHAYLVKEAAQALANAVQEFDRLGYYIKIWDAYRPLPVQKIFWQLVPDERYVADPAKGSCHNRGCAIDLTLVDKKTSKELDMGTDFDNFTELAHRTYDKFPPHILENRKLLERVMHKHGFIGLPTEWWHFDYHAWQNYPLLTITLD